MASADPDWQFKKVEAFPLSQTDPVDALSLPDGRVAVTYWEDEYGIEMFTGDGPQETVLRGGYNHVSIVYVLSDGRYVVRDDSNNITLYTHAWERLNVKFNTLSYSEDASSGGMCVDRDDNIYLGYCKTNKIDVFRPEGGAPLRGMACPGYEPRQICHMNHSKRLVIHDGSTSVIIDDMDEKGTVLHQVDSTNTRIAVLKDDSILITCREDGLLSMELYTEDLKRIKTVLEEFPMADYMRRLVEFPTGDIAVLTYDKLIVFRKI